MTQGLDTATAFDTFRSTVRKAGVREGLAFLLQLTDYRFIGIWRFQDGKADAAVYYDRNNPSQVRATEVPDDATYCCYVRTSRGIVMIADSMQDLRTVGHPTREAIASYCGVPVMDADGQIFGTLCHYDLAPRDPEQVDTELMIQVASFLALGGYVPPYPQPPIVAPVRSKISAGLQA